MVAHPSSRTGARSEDLGAAVDGAFRVLPSVAALVADARSRGTTLGEEALTRLVQDELARQRAAIAAGARPTRDEVGAAVAAAIAEVERPRLAPLLNATGVIVHTNLGRAPVSAETAAAMAAAAGGYVALELEPATNERGGRMREIAGLMRLLTGAEATLVVNNCAAAVLLVLSAVAAGRSVVVSRGEAVEIGGGFRVPDVLRQSGATLVEVGTTNRTYARDYAAATDEQTAAYLKVHPSNFQILGFVHAASTGELAELGRERGIPVLEDLGSGALLDTSRFGLGREPTLRESLAAGASLAMASGDKLLGGPQAGIIVGEQVWIERVARHPLARAVRADKTCLAGLAATLRHYVRDEAEAKIPVWRMIATPAEAIRERAAAMSACLLARGITVDVEATAATVGGGSLPGQRLDSFALAFGSAGGGDEEVVGPAHRLRIGCPAVFGRIERNRLLLDLRTILPEDDERLADAVTRAVTAEGAA